MAISEMNIRERWVAALEFESVDRLPFWPKIDAAYSKRHSGKVAGGDLWEYLQYDRPGNAFTPVEYVYDKCSQRTVNDNDENRTFFRTPHGELCLVKVYDSGSCSWHPVEYPVKGPEEIKLLTEFYRDRKSVYDPEAVFRTDADDRTFCPVNGIGISPIMDWLQHLAGIENGHFLLLDYPELVEELFAVIQEGLLERAGLLAEHSDAELIYLIENTSTTLLSPDQYRLYCKEQIRDIAAVVHQRKKRLALHMCGYINGLLPDLRYVGADAFEALTPPPVANTTLAQARDVCPDVCLIGGTGAVTWLKPAKEIIAEIEERLDKLPHHRGIVISSGGVLPPDCALETLTEVFTWLKNFKPRF